MPLYVYQCKKCKEKLEVLQKISETNAPDCPKKEGDQEHQMERVIAGSSTFVLKGSGWYKDGY